MKALPNFGDKSHLLYNIKHVVLDSLIADHWGPLRIFISGLVFSNLEYEALLANFFIPFFCFSGWLHNCFTNKILWNHTLAVGYIL
jgi:hypothetical protein